LEDVVFIFIVKLAFNTYISRNHWQFLVQDVGSGTLAMEQAEYI
jgi:hypothetical protein